MVQVIEGKILIIENDFSGRVSGRFGLWRVRANKSKVNVMFEGIPGELTFRLRLREGRRRGRDFLNTM